jgi:transcription termination factor Rho
VGSVLCIRDRDELEAMVFLLDKVKATKNNADFFDSMRRG